MSYSIKVSETGDYIHVDVKGNFDGKTALQFAGQSFKLGKKFDIIKYFVDLRNSRNIQKVGDKYNFVIQDFSNIPEINKSAKVTCIVNPDDHSHDFIETVMRNNGINFTIFRDMNEALDHLHSK